MNALTKLAKLIILVAALLWIAPMFFVGKVRPYEIGVRQSVTSGVLPEDLNIGWHWRIPGLHKLILLPSPYFMLDYTNDDSGPQTPLLVRTN